METAPYMYRGLEVRLFVYPRQRTKAGAAHCYDEGFDAAVRIKEPAETAAEARTRIFTLKVERAFANTGDARRASAAYAQHLIDACQTESTIWDIEA